LEDAPLETAYAVSDAAGAIVYGIKHEEGRRCREEGRVDKRPGRKRKAKWRFPLLSCKNIILPSSFPCM